MYKYDLGQTVLLLLLIFPDFPLCESEGRAAVRESERVREERFLPLCSTAVCGEDSELKVVALQLVIVYFLHIVIVGVVHSRGFSRIGFSTLNPV